MSLAHSDSRSIAQADMVPPRSSGTEAPTNLLFCHLSLSLHDLRWLLSMKLVPLVEKASQKSRTILLLECHHLEFGHSSIHKWLQGGWETSFFF